MNEDGMKRTVTPAMIAGVVAVVVLVLAFIGYKTFASSTNAAPPPAQAKQMNQNNSSDYSSQLRTAPRPGSGGSNYNQQYSQQMGQMGQR